MAPAETERALIDHDETDAHFRNHEEHSFDTANQKDTKYSWFICCCTFLTQVFVLGVLHAFGVFFVEFVKEFSAPKGEAGMVKHDIDRLMVRRRLFRCLPELKCSCLSE